MTPGTWRLVPGNCVSNLPEKFLLNEKVCAVFFIKNKNKQISLDTNKETSKVNFYYHLLKFKTQLVLQPLRIVLD